MSIEIKALEPGGFERFLKTCEAAFGQAATAADAERLARVIEDRRLLYAAEGEQMVGTTGAFRFSLTVPGARQVAAAGVTMVGVLPSHRRQGVLNNLMRRQLDDVHSWGEPIAVLYASEGGIYGRYGYGLASLQGEVSLLRDRAAWRAPRASYGSMRLARPDDGFGAMARVYDQVRVLRPGMFARSDEWWMNHRLADDAEDERGGGGPRWQAILSTDDGPEGYALYRVHPHWEAHAPHGWVEVIEAMGTNPLAEQAVWAYLFAIDLVREVQARAVPPDLPLLHQLAEPRRLRLMLRDALWVRILDVRKALEGRAYARDDRLIFDLTDPFCPWNARRYELVAEGGSAEVRPTSSEPALALDVTDLGALYLGGFSASALVAAGRVGELEAGAARRADGLFASDRHPWCPEMF
jgi:predicted acetyltransferase